MHLLVRSELIPTAIYSRNIGRLLPRDFLYKVLCKVSINIIQGFHKHNILYKEHRLTFATSSPISGTRQCFHKHNILYKEHRPTFVYNKEHRPRHCQINLQCSYCIDQTGNDWRCSARRPYMVLISYLCRTLLYIAPDQLIWYQIKLAMIGVPTPEARVLMKGLALKDTIKLPLVCGLAARGAKIILCQPHLRR